MGILLLLRKIPGFFILKIMFFLERNAQFLAGYIEETTGRRLKVEPGQGGNDENVIMLGLDASIDNPEGYELTVLPDRVTIKGQAANGVFYGLQTLRKSVPAIAYGSDIILPAAVIKDAPRFAYRGMMLDVGRHFFLGRLCEAVY